MILGVLRGLSGCTKVRGSSGLRSVRVASCALALLTCLRGPVTERSTPMNVHSAHGSSRSPSCSARPALPPTHTRPITSTPQRLDGQSAADYPIPQDKPTGNVRVASFGFVDLGAHGAPQDEAHSLHALHLRMVVSNDSPKIWTLDTRRQRLDLTRRGQSGAAFASADQGHRLRRSRSTRADIASSTSSTRCRPPAVAGQAPRVRRCLHRHDRHGTRRRGGVVQPHRHPAGREPLTTTARSTGGVPRTGTTRPTRASGSATCRTSLRTRASFRSSTWARRSSSSCTARRAGIVDPVRPETEHRASCGIAAVVLSTPPRRDRHRIGPSVALSLLGGAFGRMIWLPIPWW